MAAKHIELEVHGCEKAGFIRYWMESHQDNDGNMHFEEKSEKVKFGKTFADYKMKVFEIPGH